MIAVRADAAPPFADYAERGRRFKEEVRKLIAEA